jgi:hypothetical protein
MELQRSLGDRTWNRSEIRAELDRLRTDIDKYLGSQVVCAHLLFSLVCDSSRVDVHTKQEVGLMC